MARGTSCVGQRSYDVGHRCWAGRLAVAGPLAGDDLRNAQASDLFRLAGPVLYPLAFAVPAALIYSLSTYELAMTTFQYCLAITVVTLTSMWMWRAGPGGHLLRRRGRNDPLGDRKEGGAQLERRRRDRGRHEPDRLSPRLSIVDRQSCEKQRAVVRRCMPVDDLAHTLQPVLRVARQAPARATPARDRARPDASSQRVAHTKAGSRSSSVTHRLSRCRMADM